MIYGVFAGELEEEKSYALAKQWEDYANSISSRLSEEQTRGASLKDDLEKEIARVKELDAALKEKDNLIGLLQRELKKAEKEEQKGARKGTSEEEAKAKKLAAEVEGLKGKLAKSEAALKDLKVQDKPVDDLQKKLDAALSKAATVDALDSEVKNLKSQISSLEKQVTAAEEGVTVCKSSLKESEEALLLARKEVLKAEQEVAAKALELGQLSGRVLPPWAVKKVSVLQSHAAFHWKTHGEPTVSHLKKTTLKATADARKWASPHLETAKAATVRAAGSARVALKPVTEFVVQQHKKLAPVAEEYWKKTSTALNPHVETVKRKALEGYNVASDFLEPHVQTVTKISEPYVKAVNEAVDPHYTKFKTAVGPSVVKIRSTTAAYHEHLHSRVKAAVKEHGGSFSEEATSYLASALLVLPLLLAIILGWPSLRGSKKIGAAKHEKSTAAHKKHRRPKRD